MNLLDFISSVINSISWPISIIVIVVIFRKSISELLPKLRQFQYKDFKIIFEKNLAKIQSDLQIPALKKASNQLPKSKELKTKSNKKSLEFYKTLAEVSPRAMMVEVWNDFEIIGNQIYKNLKLSKAYSSLSMAELINVLYKKEYLSKSEAEALVKLRALRNELVHTKNTNISIDNLAEYSHLLNRITEKLKHK